MHLEALCMPETPIPDDYNANESTRHLLLPRPRQRSAQFGLHNELAMAYKASREESLEAIMLGCQAGQAVVLLAPVPRNR